MRTDKLLNFAFTFGTINTNWIDDFPDTVAGYAEIINDSCKNKIKCNVLENISISKKIIEESNASQMIFDINLDKTSIIDGLSKAKRLRQIAPLFPISIISSYLSEYTKRVNELRNEPNISIISKDSLKDTIYKKFLTDLKRYSSSYHILKKTNASNLSWTEFHERSDLEYIYEAHMNIYGQWAQKMLFESSMEWICIIGNEIVDGSTQLRSFPDLRAKEKIAQQYRKMPFFFTKSIICEEAQIRDSHLNYYPKYNVGIDHSSYSEFNFDTGTNRTVVSDELVEPELGSSIEKSIHLGKTYRFSTNVREINIAGGINDSDVPIKLPIAIVKNWEKSPWVKVNSYRKGVLGRDIFANAEIEIKLQSYQTDKNVITHISKM